MLQLTFNPGLTLTGFRTTRPYPVVARKLVSTEESSHMNQWSFLFSPLISLIADQISSSVKQGWQAYTTPTVHGIWWFVHLPFTFRSLDLFCRSTLVYEEHFVLCYKQKLEPVECAIRKIVRGHRSVWFPLLSAWHFLEFDTYIIGDVLLLCFGSFLYCKICF